MDSKLVTPSPTAEDREKAMKIIEKLPICSWDLDEKGRHKSLNIDSNLTVNGAITTIAHALATTRQAAEEGQREADARVARDFMMCCENHNNDEIAEAIRATGGGSTNG